MVHQTKPASLLGGLTFQKSPYRALKDCVVAIVLR